MKPSPNTGFTLVELLVAMAAASIVMVAVVSAYQVQVRSKNTQEVLTDMNQTARAALEIMTHEIRMAGCDPTLTAGAGILIANPNELRFSMDIVDPAAPEEFRFRADGLTTGPNENVHYAINADGHLGRDTGGGLQPLARNVNAVDIVYLDADGNVTAALDEIRAIQVTIVARAGDAAGGFRHAHTDSDDYLNQ
ncbi:MAG TPA: prepilin-type N-terminal cleavage/methylation domain-containing protein, partial [Desulfobacterales bacterium]|nr:prepilin-type N-terminal cleavage/methylation domain-containing protein [Desulfobacterales bacterium]